MRRARGGAKWLGKKVGRSKSEVNVEMDFDHTPHKPATLPHHTTTSSLPHSPTTTRITLRTTRHTLTRSLKRPNGSSRCSAALGSRAYGLSGLLCHRMFLALASFCTSLAAAAAGGGSAHPTQTPPRPLWSALPPLYSGAPSTREAYTHSLGVSAQSFSASFTGLLAHGHPQMPLARLIHSVHSALVRASGSLIRRVFVVHRMCCPVILCLVALRHSLLRATHMLYRLHPCNK